MDFFFTDRNVRSGIVATGHVCFWVFTCSRGTEEMDCSNVDGSSHLWLMATVAKATLSRAGWTHSSLGASTTCKSHVNHERLHVFSFEVPHSSAEQPPWSQREKKIFNKFSKVDATLWLEPGNRLESRYVGIRALENSQSCCDLLESHRTQLGPVDRSSWVLWTLIFTGTKAQDLLNNPQASLHSKPAKLDSSIVDKGLATLVVSTE